MIGGGLLRLTIEGLHWSVQLGNEATVTGRLVAQFGRENTGRPF
jgi:hypothetical protein